METIKCLTSFFPTLPSTMSVFSAFLEPSSSFHTLTLREEFSIPPFQLIALQGSSFIKAIKFYFTTKDISGIGVVVNTETVSSISRVLKIML